MRVPSASVTLLVEPLQNRLVRGDSRVKLDPKVMQVLVYLADRPKEIADHRERLGGNVRLRRSPDMSCHAFSVHSKPGGEAARHFSSVPSRGGR